jgi:hypothetical protein
VTAGTRKALERLMFHFQKEIICFFSLADFCNETINGFIAPCLKLYGWPAHLNQSAVEIERA